MRTTKTTFMSFIALLLLYGGNVQAQRTECKPNLQNSRFTIDNKILADSALNNKVSLELDIQVIKGEKTVSQKINNAVMAFIKKSILPEELSLPPANNYEEVATQFMKVGQDVVNSVDKEFRDSYTNVINYEVESRVICSNSKLVNIIVSVGGYTGGAHGFTHQSSLLFDANTGETYTLPLPELTSDYDQFKVIAEKVFRKTYKIKKGKSINESGFWFEHDSFSLSNKLCIEKEGIQFLFNPYEVAPYAMGPIVFTVPYKELKSILDFDKIGLDPIL